MGTEVLVRSVEAPDVPAVSKLAEALVSYHRDLDPKRYMRIERAAEGYARFLSGEIDNEKAVVLCAIRGDAHVGYAYGKLEGRNWSLLLDPHGALHDVFVAPSARRQGVAQKLVLETCRRLEKLGAPRVLLHTAVQNREAQALFAKLGFRSTMLEMTREA
ncbi:MAG: GNAT family N-acetyltransferase [Polyangiaceae bacterium]